MENGGESGDVWFRGSRGGEGKREEAELEAAEIKRSSFTLAVTRRESVRNEDIRGASQC